MKRSVINRRGASLAAALILFMICTFVSLTVITAALGNSRRNAEINRIELDYKSASSAAELICDSVTSHEDFNIIAATIMQFANGTGDSTLIIKISADDLPDAVCTVDFDEEFNLEATVETKSFTIHMTMLAEVPGKAGWKRENMLITREERRNVQVTP